MPKRHYKNSWTPEEDDIIRKAVADGKRNQDITPLLPHRTPVAVIRRRANLKLGKPLGIFSQNDPATVAQIVKFRLAGWRVKDIEKATGVCRTRLSFLLSRQGIRLPLVLREPNPRKTRWTALETARLRRCLQHKEPLSLIYEKFPHRTPNAIKKKVYHITRYWLSDAERKERQRLKDNQLKVDWSAPRKQFLSSAHPFHRR